MKNSAIIVAITLNFEDLRHDDDTISKVPCYNRNGFTLIPFHTNPGPATFNIPGTLSPNFFGSTTLFNGTSGGNNVLTTTVGGPLESLPFNLLSIDLVENPSFIQDPTTGEVTPADSGPYDITFFGLRQDGSSVTDTFTITNFPVIETFRFSGMTNLVSVNWNGGRSTQFNNIVVEPVPEPSTMLLGSGL